MTKLTVFIGLLMAIMCNSIAQERYLDTLSSKGIDNYPFTDDKFNVLLVNADFSLSRDFNQSLKFIEEAEGLIVKSDRSNLQNGRLDLARAEYLFEVGDFTSSMNYLVEALKVFEISEEPKYLWDARNLFAKLERENDNYEIGIKICTAIIEKAKDAKDYLRLASYHLNIANIYITKKGKDYGKALDHLNSAKDTFEKVGVDTGVAYVQIKLARYYKVLFMLDKNDQNLDSALLYANKALNTFKNLGQNNNLAYAYYTIATSYSIAGDHKNSIPIYNKALEKYETLDNLIYSMRIYQHLFVAHSILGEQSMALQTNKNYIKLKDSIFTIEKRQLLTEAQIKFDTQKIQKEKEIAELQSTKNKSLFIGSAIIAGLILLSSLFYLGRIKATKKAELVAIDLKETQKRLALEKQYRDSELKALKAQMNPHFIFNALNSIQDYIVLNQKNLASDYLGKFADLIRNYLHYSDTGYISIPDEVENLERYLELEKLRFEENLEYTFEVAETINSDVYKIPTMLIQPYIENALKHGLLHKKADKKLRIELQANQDDIITCIIEDNGIGRKKSREINAASNKNHKSFALKANVNRLELLNQNNPKKIGVEIVDLYSNEKPVGTRVLLNIPVN